MQGPKPDEPVNHTGSNIGALYTEMTKLNFCSLFTTLLPFCPELNHENETLLANSQ